MNSLCWNCRGLGNAVTVRELRDLARQFAPSVFCVVETQLHKSRVECLNKTLGYDNSFGVSSEGRSGGLGIFWNNDTPLTITKFYKYHIDAEVR